MAAPRPREAPVTTSVGWFTGFPSSLDERTLLRRGWRRSSCAVSASHHMLTLIREAGQDTAVTGTRYDEVAKVRGDTVSLSLYSDFITLTSFSDFRVQRFAPFFNLIAYMS